MLLSIKQITRKKDLVRLCATHNMLFLSRSYFHLYLSHSTVNITECISNFLQWHCKTPEDFRSSLQRIVNL